MWKDSRTKRIDLNGEKMVKIPNAEDFRKKVEKMEENYGITDCIYVQCTEEFSQHKLIDLNNQLKTRIIERFLFDWGKMQRQLGDEGLEKVYRKIKGKHFADRVEPLRNKSLKSTNSKELEDLIISLFDEIAGVSFKNAKQTKDKTAGSTTASKVLHLCCPDLFVMWDVGIRAGYEKWNENGEDYFQFLNEIKKLWIALDRTIIELQKKYEKRATRLIDEYNWRTFHRE
jgi:hypothetical protein